MLRTGPLLFNDVTHMPTPGCRHRSKLVFVYYSGALGRAVRYGPSSAVSEAGEAELSRPGGLSDGLTPFTPVVGAGADPLARLVRRPAALMGNAAAQPELIGPDVSRDAPHCETDQPPSYRISIYFFASLSSGHMCIPRIQRNLA